MYITVLYQFPLITENLAQFSRDVTILMCAVLTVMLCRGYCIFECR